MADLLTSIRAEIDARLRELAPAIAEYERLSTAADALAAEGRRRAIPSPPRARRSDAPAKAPARPPAKKAAAPRRAAPRRAATRARKPEEAAHSPAGQAILAALEHGSHTLAELVTVTALRGSDIREALRQLRRHKAIVKTERDGRAA